MKKILIALLILLLAGCTNGADLTPEAEPADSISADYQRTTSLSFTIPYNNTRNRYAEIDNWETYFYETYGYEINISYNTINTDLSAMDSIVFFNCKSDYIMQNMFDIKKMMETGQLYDISTYYDQYNWYQYIDDTAIDYVTMNDEIMALPVSSFGYSYPRYYNENYLKELSLNVPTNVSEFYDYLLATRKMNSYDESFYPFIANSNNIIRNTADLFRSSGVYFNSEKNNTIAYNPLTKSIEDGMFSENSLEAIQYIRFLQENKVFSIFDSNGTNFDKIPYNINKNYATEYYIIYSYSGDPGRNDKYEDPVYLTRTGYFLEGNNKERLMEVNKDISFYVFPAGISNLAGKMELFNTIFTDNQYYYDLKYGIKNIDYEIQDHNLTINMPSYGAMLDLELMTGFKDPGATSFMESVQVIDQADEPLLYDVSYIHHEILKLGFTPTINNEFDDIIKRMFNTRNSLEDEVAAYKELFRKSGGIEYIDLLNEKLGSVTSYKYHLLDF
ncbi:MAG: hypothetical protein JXQ23_04630 [Clostridia bacterium]|nr:hypothetical protein [Clostridia bacterium]